MPRRLTTASFEIRHLSNAVRLMCINHDQRNQTLRYTLSRLSVDAGRTPVSSNTLTVYPGGFQTIRIDNLKAGFYELTLRLSSRKLKPSVDVRDGTNKTDAEYCRFLINPSNLIRTDR